MALCQIINVVRLPYTQEHNQFKSNDGEAPCWLRVRLQVDVDVPFLALLTIVAEKWRVNDFSNVRLICKGRDCPNACCEEDYILYSSSILQ
jgi:hypothetical protein